uniref:Uncharacterized protein n=1 Tax=Stachyamoeba lipophora TaxID=463046 RepID=A0A0B5GSJ0_STALP|nr:hypothetical protein [Stachyamoeba lipophora]AJF22920.1 hypothetical protein [Stachyamoeba lipophora]
MFIFYIIILAYIIDLYYTSLYIFDSYLVIDLILACIPGQGTTPIHFFAMFLFLFILNRALKKMSMDEFCLDYADWIFTFTYVSNIKYNHYASLRYVILQLNVLLNSYGYWKKKFINSNKPIEKIMFFMKKYYFYIHQLNLFSKLLSKKTKLLDQINIVARSHYFVSYYSDDYGV